MAEPCFTPDESLVLDAYFAGRDETEPDVSTACDRVGVPSEVYVRRIDAAVGQIMVQGIQDTLPNFGICRGDRVVMGRNPRPVTVAAETLEPCHLFTINWADSGPGISWPEAYHVVFVPTYERFVVVASQDSPDARGCTDQALGSFGPARPVEEAAGEILRSYWAAQLAEYDQHPWPYLFDEGLVDRATAESWREMVWGIEDGEDES